MKQVLLVILAVITMNTSSKAQLLQLVNNRQCDVEFTMFFSCRDFCYVIHIPVPAMGTVSYNDVYQAAAAVAPSLQIVPCNSYVWHAAELQNMNPCSCLGGVVVGDPAIRASCHPPLPYSFTNCTGSTCGSSVCGNWTYMGPPGAVRVTAY